MAAADAGGVALDVAQERRARVRHSPFCSNITRHVQEVAARVDQHALGLEAVAAGAAGLLLIVLERLRRAGVHDEAHVGSIDPHPERDGRDDDVDVFVEERVLIAMARRRRSSPA